MVRALLIWLLALQSVSGGLARYRDLVLADPHQSRSSLGKVGINYLGTNAYRFETAGHVLLVDPYFSRLGLGAFVFPAPITPKLDRINAAANFISGADVILATHGHVDHLLDVPPIMQTTGARLLASPTAVESSGQFFQPLARGFAFGFLSDFRWILRETRREKLPSRLILLDYFQRWTLREKTGLGRPASAPFDRGHARPAAADRQYLQHLV
jgi:hypothetical protein